MKTLDEIVAGLEDVVSKAKLFDFRISFSSGSGTNFFNSSRPEILEHLTHLIYTNPSQCSITTAIDHADYIDGAPRVTTSRKTVEFRVSKTKDYRPWFRITTVTPDGGSRMFFKRTPAESFEKFWKKEVAGLEAETLKFYSQRLDTLKVLDVLRREPSSYFFGLPRDLTQFLLGPMINDRVDPETE